MVYEIFSIKDELVGFGQPFLCDNEPVATRQFASLVNADGQMPHFRPKDYTLYKIGSFDTHTGVISPLESPSFVVGADSLREE